MQESDQKLVQRCLQGDTRAWERLVRLYTGRIYNMAYQYTGRFEVAEEMTQEIFLKVYQNLSTYRPEMGPLRNWIMRVGRNLLIDFYRSTRKEKQVAGSDELDVLDFRQENTQPGPFENVYLRERTEFLLQGMQRLTHELREAVLLRDIQGLSYQEIAEVLNIPEGTVKSRINRGRIELAKTLRGQSGEGRAL